MNPTAGPACPLRIAFLVIGAVLLVGSDSRLSTPALAQLSAQQPPGTGGKTGSGPGATAKGGKGQGATAKGGAGQGGLEPGGGLGLQPGQEQGEMLTEISEGRSWLPIVLVVMLVVVLMGGLVFLFTRQQGGKASKDKVSESADSIGGYRLDKSLQQGHTSQVWEVAEIVSGRHFAMKMLLPEYAKNAVQRQLLFNEADVGIEMAHPNVIKIIRVFKQARTPCFVMEFFPSGSMRQRIMYKDWDFIKEHALNLLKQTATGLAYMNSNGWLHRDVKPDNILVNSAGDVRLIDFAITERIPTGLARMFRRKGARKGTRSYMSPEAIRCELLDTRSDIYSFGITCYEIVTFRTPFKAGNSDDLLNKQLFEKPTPPQAFCPDLTDEFNKLILRMLAKKREERPHSFHEVLMELRKVKIFKTVHPAPPKDGGPLALHPEAMTSIRRPTGKPAAPKPPDGGPKPKS